MIIEQDVKHEEGEMLLGLETFSYHLSFAYGTMDIFAFIERVKELGLDGVQINVEGTDWGHLGGADPGHLRDVRAMAEDLGMFVELDTCGTDPKHLAKVLKVCKALGADVLRVYASIGGDLAKELRQAPEHFRQVLPICADCGVRISFENHEYETSQDVLDVVRKVGSKFLGTHVDTGNSMMVWEDPVEAVKAMAPFAVSTHFKDHAVIMQYDEPMVVGVPLGKGSMDCAECFRLLANNSPLKRINIEVCYGYIAPFRRTQEQGAGAKLGEGAFRVQKSPFDPSCIAPYLFYTLDEEGERPLAWAWQDLAALIRSDAERKKVLTWQDRAVVDSVEFVKEFNNRFGSRKYR